MRISDWSSDVCSSDLLAAARLLHRCHPDAAQHHRGHAHHGLRLRAGRLPAAADSRPAAALDPLGADHRPGGLRSEEHTSELQSLMRISYAVFCLKKKITKQYTSTYSQQYPTYTR